MKVLKIIGGLLLAIITIVLLYASLLAPKETRVERTVRINAKDSLIMSKIANFYEFKHYSPWQALDPNMKQEFGGNPNTVGHWLRWESDKAGVGKLIITRIENYKQVEMDLLFEKPFKSNNKSYFTIVPNAQGNDVTWGYYGKNDFISKIFTLFMNMDKMIGNDYEKGLNNLKAICETK